MFDITTLVQISDCHLFASRSGQHFHANVYENLYKVLSHIKLYSNADLIIFTGDLSQDHSLNSYQLFVNAFIENGINIPVYFLAGNHDEQQLLQENLSVAPFIKQDIIELSQWQLLLVDSKSDTPSGEVKPQQLQAFQKQINPEKAQLLFMHHHPVDVGYFIDKHGLLNKDVMMAFIEKNHSVAGMACGHVHQGLTYPLMLEGRNINLYTCPATSIQFDSDSEQGKVTKQGAGYRIFTLDNNKQLTTEVIYLS